LLIALRARRQRDSHDGTAVKTGNSAGDHSGARKTILQAARRVQERDNCTGKENQQQNHDGRQVLQANLVQ
jgi:hypothetical protein